MKTILEPKERPILFSTKMVKAILAGNKTQTRRIVKGPWIQLVSEILRVNGKWVWETMDYSLTTPLGEIGDRLWVRETFMGWYRDGVFSHVAAFKADGYEAEQGEKWTPSIHMPRKASRITLEITNVRVERMQDGGDREFWGEDKWNQNPWVWVYEFKRINL